jgi:carboxyl-terminal processing protease
VKRLAGYLAALVAVIGAFALGFFLTQSAPRSSSTTAPLRADRPVRLVDQVRAVLASSYYRLIDPDVLRRPTVGRLLKSLHDPHTDYLTASEYAALEETTHGTYSGIGLEVDRAERGLVVTSVPPGPAREAGIRRGDVIIRIEGKSVEELRFEQSLALIKGKNGTLVHLAVKRSHKPPITFTVEREEIAVPQVSARMMTTGTRKVAYIRVFSFPEKVSLRIEQATNRLVEEGAKGAIIDLRENPGGLLSEAIAVASIYLADGVVCRTNGLHQDERVYTVTGVATQPRLPLVVLVDGRSASAAEVLAAALHDHDRAIVVGERTYGKASVQSIAPLRDGGALKLTTARYVTPAGADITGVGVTPRIAAVDDPLTPRDEALRVAGRVLVGAIGS